MQQWVDEKRDIELIKKILLAEGFDDETIEAHINEFTKLEYVKGNFPVLSF